MKHLISCLSVLTTLVLSAAALEVVDRPLSVYGYTYYAIDSDGTLWAWGDSFHGGITAESDPVDWENAVPEVENAAYASGSFAVGLAVDREGVLWGWGDDFAGALRGQDASAGAVPLLDHVVSAEADEGGVQALRDDGTLWSWNVESPPHQVLDYVRACSGGWAVLDNGTLLELREEPRPVASHAAWAAYDWYSQTVLIWGEDGNLYRIRRDYDTDWFQSPELLLKDVVSISSNMAVTAEGTLWAWGRSLPLVQQGGELVQPTQEEARRVMLGEPLRCLENVRYGEAGMERTLVILADGSLLQLPSFYAPDLANGDTIESQVKLRKLLDQATPVSWREADKSALPPELVGMKGQTISWQMLVLCVLPVAGAALVYIWKGREKSK